MAPNDSVATNDAKDMQCKYVLYYLNKIIRTLSIA